MGVVVACQRCGAQLRSKDEFAGRPVRCPYCHAINRLPGRPNTPPPEEERQVCPICNGHFKEFEEPVKGPRGVLYHRTCFELERARWRSHQWARFKSAGLGDVPVESPSAALPPPAAVPQVSQPPAPQLPASPLPASPLPASPLPASNRPVPLPATVVYGPASQSDELAPLDWPTGWKELLEEWDAKRPGAAEETTLLHARSSRWRRWLWRNKSVKRLVVLGISLSLPAVALIVVLGVVLPSVPERRDVSTPIDTAEVSVPADMAEVSAPVDTVKAPVPETKSPLPPGYVTIPGTDVWLPEPAGFAVDAKLPGLVQQTTGASVMVVEMRTPFPELRASITPDGDRSRAAGVLQWRPVTVGGYAGILRCMREDGLGGVRLKWIATFGDDQRTCSVIAAFPERLEANLSETLCQTVLGAKWMHGESNDPLADLGFRLNIPTGLQLAERADKIVTYTIDGNPPRSLEEPLCLVGSLQIDVSAADRQQFAEKLIEKTGLLTHVTIQECGSTMVDGVQGYRIDALARDASEQVPLIVFQVALFKADHCYFVQGMATDHYVAEYYPKFQSMAWSFRQR